MNFPKQNYFLCGLSKCVNLTQKVVETKFHVPAPKKQCIIYRSYKHFDNDNYLYVNSTDDAYWFSSQLLKDSQIDSESKMLLFNYFVISQFDFCPVIWHFCKR